MAKEEIPVLWKNKEKSIIIIPKVYEALVKKMKE
jgi:hypothetical protein